MNKDINELNGLLIDKIRFCLSFINNRSAITSDVQNSTVVANLAKAYKDLNDIEMNKEALKASLNTDICPSGRASCEEDSDNGED